MNRCAIVCAICGMLTTVAGAQTTRPATAPGNRSAEDMLRQMLQPPGESARPLRPTPALPPADDVTSGAGAVPPAATSQPVMREGTLLLDRIGRLTSNGSGKMPELSLESDGRSMTDPPLVLLPSRTVMQLEDHIKNSNRDLRIRVSGEITEYRGRNYLFVQRWSQVPETVLPLQ